MVADEGDINSLFQPSIGVEMSSQLSLEMLVKAPWRHGLPLSTDAKGKPKGGRHNRTGQGLTTSRLPPSLKNFKERLHLLSNSTGC